MYENGKLALITDATYDNGRLLTYKQAFPGHVAGGQPVWIISDRENKDNFSSGETWHYIRSGDYPQAFPSDDAAKEDIISVESFTSEISDTLEGYYAGNISGGSYNDDTGNAYMVKFFEDGSVKTLYVGYFVDGAFHDNSGYSWMIGKIEPDDEYYSYYTGPFDEGSHVKEAQYWEYSLTEDRIKEILGDRTFSIPLPGLIEAP